MTVKLKQIEGDSMLVAGIDPSLTRTGVAFLRVKNDKIVPELVTSIEPNEQEKGLVGIERAAVIAKKTAALIGTYMPNLAVIEGYSLGSKYNLARLVEGGTMVRLRTCMLLGQYLEVAPSSLKKFVLGKGKAEKDKMMLEVFARWGIKPENNDEGDAIALGAVGLAYLNLLKVPKTGLEVVAAARMHRVKGGLI
jgi:Holliday junction resolvasome RuvABC endonuclease subunit